MSFKYYYCEGTSFGQDHLLKATTDLSKETIDEIIQWCVSEFGPIETDVRWDCAPVLQAFFFRSEKDAFKFRIMWG